MKHSGQSGTMWADWWARMLMCDIHVPAQTCTSQRSRRPPQITLSDLSNAGGTHN